jgi:large subunit ribosomal protein L14
MITALTKVYISDSSGGRIAICIKVLKSKYYHASLTNKIIVAVKVVLSDRKAKRHDVLKGTIIRLVKKTSRPIGTKIWFEDNAIIVYNKRDELMGSRIFGPVSYELRFALGKKKHTKILTLASSIV